MIETFGNSPTFAVRGACELITECFCTGTATMDGYYEDYDSGRLDHDDPGENLYPSNPNADNTYDSFSDTEDKCPDIARCTDRDCPYLGHRAIQHGEACASTNGKRLTLW